MLAARSTCMRSRFGRRAFHLCQPVARGAVGGRADAGGLGHGGRGGG